MQLKVDLSFPFFFPFSFMIILKATQLFLLSTTLLWSLFCIILPICTSSPAGSELKVRRYWVYPM